MVLTYDPKDVVLLKNGLRVYASQNLLIFNELSFQKEDKKEMHNDDVEETVLKGIIFSVNNDQ